MMSAPQNGGTDNGKRTPAKMDKKRLVPMDSIKKVVL